MAAKPKLRRDLSRVLPLARLDAPATALLADCAESDAAIRRLAAAGELLAATRLGGFCLPPREAVWWACMCSIHVATAGQPDVEIKAREAAELWVRRQDDTTRRTAMELARQAGFAAPEAWAAVAAFWSSDSMAPVGQPVVPPAPHLVGTAIAGSIALASVRADPARQATRLQTFLSSLWDIDGGGAGRLPKEASG